MDRLQYPYHGIIAEVRGGATTVALLALADIH
jgi:hypothetical protein